MLIFFGERGGGFFWSMYICSERATVGGAGGQNGASERAAMAVSLLSLSQIAVYVSSACVALGLRLDRLVLVTLLVCFFYKSGFRRSSPSRQKTRHLLNTSLTCLSILTVLKVGILYNQNVLKLTS